MSDVIRPVIGQPAPGFTLPANGGHTVSLAELRGRTVVFHFCPRDDTSGRTREALDFTAEVLSVTRAFRFISHTPGERRPRHGAATII